MRLPDGTGLDLLRRMDEAGRREKAIVITAYGSPENAVEALKAGAYDYLTKPVDLRQFRAVVASALGRAARRSAATVAVDGSAVARRARAPAEPATAAAVHPALDAHRRALGGDAAGALAGRDVWRAAWRRCWCRASRAPARNWWRARSTTCSPRGAMPFVAVNCGAIPEALLEAEFFGYRKGAFTGANEDREGFFQAAQGGTLFLDEIGDLPLAMQSKLLRVIQERAVRPVGAVAETPINVRIVSATHKDLGAEVHGRTLPPGPVSTGSTSSGSACRRCASASTTCRRSALPCCSASPHDAGVAPVPTLDADALQHLLRYGFPGNVRELENLLHRALALAGTQVILRADLALPDELLAERDAGIEASPPQAPAAPVTPAPATLPSDLAAHLDAVEREILELALERHRYNRTAAGASLGLSLRQMRYRMARLGIGAPDGERIDPV